MLGAFKNIFDGSNKEQNDGDRELKLRVATCVLLKEAATADSNFSSEEQEKIIQILKSRFQMDDTSVKELVDKSTMGKKNSTDLWYFTNLINAQIQKFRHMFIHFRNVIFNVFNFRPS